MRFLSVLLLVFVSYSVSGEQSPPCLDLAALIEQNRIISNPQITLVDFRWEDEEPQDTSWIGPHRSDLLDPLDSDFMNLFRGDGAQRFPKARDIAESSETELSFVNEVHDLYLNPVMKILEQTAQSARLMATLQNLPKNPKRNYKGVVDFYGAALDKSLFDHFENRTPETVGKGLAMFKLLSSQPELRAELYELRVRKGMERAQLLREKYRKIKTTFSLQPDGSLKVTMVRYYGPAEFETQSLVTKTTIVRWGKDPQQDSKSASLRELEQVISVR